MIDSAIMKIGRSCFLTLGLSILLGGVLSAAEYYRWIDQNGVIHFTDNLHDVPERQRSNVGRIRASDSIRAPEPEKPLVA